MPEQSRHPIGVVAERTGLTPDVIRVWERRYRVVEPARSPGGQRLYTDADIERLSLLHRAIQGGHGISHVASLSQTKLADLVRDIESRSHRLTPAFPVVTGEPVSGLIAVTKELDPLRLEALLKRSVARYGIVAFVDQVAAPFLREIGNLWHDGKLSVSEEHLATAVVQRVVTDTAPLLTGGEGHPSIVIATLEGERHTNGALMAAAAAASEGWRVIYLGADLPAGEIANMAERTGSRAVGISMVLSDRRQGSLLRALRRELDPGCVLIAGGNGSMGIADPEDKSGIRFVDSMSGLHLELATLRSAIR